MYMNSKLSEKLSDWLLYPGSFMQRLKHHHISDACIDVLKEGWDLPFEEERYRLKLPESRLAWIREVVIYSGSTTWMFARTVIPQKTLTGKEKRLQHLKTRSLGSILFQYPDLIRSDFEIFPIEPETHWEKNIAKYLPIQPETLWARRSEFIVRKKSLLLTEVFFPSIVSL
jgi:chorismate--pyruvate lyase